MQIQAVKVQRLYLQVAQQLRELIEGGVFAVGERLPSERDLAQRFEVSRPTIREAMIALELAGLVEVRSGSGVYVRDAADGPTALSDTQGPGPFEILEARRLLEGECCALAAEHASDEQLQALRAIVDDMAEENRREDVTEEADRRFHCLIAEASGNSAYAAVVAWLWQLRNDSDISAHFQARVRREGIRPVVDDHREIVDALGRRDGDAARESMQRHLQRVVDHLMEVS
ncbi:MAG: FadR/GntR family transcriptional regulator [Halioglobus sp.]